MKVLVTGTHGQLARSLVERAQNGSTIRLLPLGRPELDLEEAGSAARAVKSIEPDVVINAAAYTAVDLAEDEPERAFQVNKAAAGEIAAAARDVGARIIHLSTDYVFDGAGDGPYAEEAPTNPLSTYGRSKLEGEELVRQLNPHHVVVRTAWVYSPFGSNFVKTMIRLGQTRDEVSVVCDQIGNPTSALDLADGLLTIIDQWAEGGTTGLGEKYHLAGNGAASWADLAEAVFSECTSRGLRSVKIRKIATSDWPTKAHRPRNSQLDSTKFRKDFGFEMPQWRTSVTSTVSRLLNTGTIGAQSSSGAVRKDAGALKHRP